MYLPRRSGPIVSLIVMIVLSALQSACSVSAPEPTPTPTNTPIPPTATPVPPTDTPLPTATDTPIPTDTPEPIADLYGKVLWREEEKPINASVSLTGKVSQNVASGATGDFSFNDLDPGEYQIVTELMFDNPIFDPCTSMSFSSNVPGWSYSMLIRNGEMAGIKATSDSFTLDAGDELEMDVPFSFTCN